MNELSHKSGPMYELTHSHEILFMPQKVIILSHAMSYHLEKRCTHVMMYFYAMIFTFIIHLQSRFFCPGLGGGPRETLGCLQSGTKHVATNPTTLKYFQ